MFCFARTALTSALELKQRQRDDYMEKVQMLGVTINSISEEKLRLAGKLQQQDKLESRKTELITNSKKLQRDIEVARIAEIMSYVCHSCNVV